MGKILQAIVTFSTGALLIGFSTTDLGAGNLDSRNTHRNYLKTIVTKPLSIKDQLIADNTFLNELAGDTWNYLHSDWATDNHLPWSWRSASLPGGDYANATEIGFYALSWLAAYDMQQAWSPDWNTSEGEVIAVLDQLRAWQTGSQVEQPYGPNAYGDSVFYQWYWINNSPPVVGSNSGDNHLVPSIDNAWLAASLITIREYAEANGHTTMAQKADAILTDMDFSLWYHNDTHRFNWGGIENPKGGSQADYFSNENRIINFIARSLGDLDANEFDLSLAALVQSSGTYDSITVEKMAYDGSYFTYAGPALFIREMQTPYGINTITPATQAQIQYADNSGYQAWGFSDSYDIEGGSYIQQGAPPVAMGGSPETQPGLVSPHASALALITAYNSSALSNLQFLTNTYDCAYDDVYGFHDSVIANGASADNGKCSYRFSALNQEWIFLSISNYLNGFIWDYFYRDDGVLAAHAEMYQPTVFNIVRADSNPTSAPRVDFTVTFSESVTGVDTTDFGLTTTGVSVASITGVSGSGSTYTVTVNIGADNGTIRLDLMDDNSIIDMVSNPLGGASVGDGDFTSGETYTINKDTTIDVKIGEVLIGTYPMDAGQSSLQEYTKANGGPVVVENTLGGNTIASLIQYRRPGFSGSWTGITQTMALTDAQISDAYVFPHYDFADSTKYNSIQLANFDTIATDISVEIGGVLQGTFAISAGGSKNVTFSGVTGGPVVVSSDNGAQIIASLYELKRTGSSGLYTGQTTMMGLPSTQLSDTYIIPRYNHIPQDILPFIVFANADNVSTNVTVTIGGNLMGTYPLDPGQSSLQEYPTANGGPVVVASDNGASIIASLLQFRRPGFSGSWTGITQTMALTDAQISDVYVFPHYDFSDSTKYNSIQLANFDSIDTNISVEIGGVLRGTYAIPAGSSQNVTFPGVTGGPVVVSSDNGAQIIATLYELKRPGSTGLYTGQTTMMGLPWAWLSDTYIIPRYNHIPQDILPYIVFGVP